MRMSSVLALGVAAMLAPPAALAEGAPVPTQEEWVDARRSATLESGLTLTYVEMGPAEGQPILLLHGYTDNARSWSLLAPHLERRRLIALDLRGHGGSDAPACCHGLDTLASDVDGFMAAIGVETADVVGHSLGAMTAATLAAYYPERVDELVLISIAATMSEGATQWLWENVPAMERPVDPEGQFMMDWYWNPNPVDEDFLSRERAESAATSEATWMGVLRALTLTDLTPVAARIAAPTLILWGDQDALFEADSQEAIRQIMPEARHVVYEGYGHNMFWEVPERVGAEITGFLTD